MLRYAASTLLGLFAVFAVLVVLQNFVVGRQFQLASAGAGNASAVLNLGNEGNQNQSLSALPDRATALRTPPMPEDPVLGRSQAPDVSAPSMPLPGFKPPFSAIASQSVAETAPESAAAPAAGTAPAAQPVLAVGDIVLVERVEPKFPTQAIRAGIDSGSVTVKFTVETDGSVSNPTVTDAKPRRGVFDDAALRAVLRWKFKPLPAPRDTSVIVVFSQGGGGG
jgi:TonB family protein